MTIAQQILLGIAIASPLLGLTWWAVKRSDRAPSEPPARRHLSLRVARGRWWGGWWGDSEAIVRR